MWFHAYSEFAKDSIIFMSSTPYPSEHKDQIASVSTIPRCLHRPSLQIEESWLRNRVGESAERGNPHKDIESLFLGEVEASTHQ